MNERCVSLLSSERVELVMYCVVHLARETTRLHDRTDKG